MMSSAGSVASEGADENVLGMPVDLGCVLMLQAR